MLFTWFKNISKNYMFEWYNFLQFNLHDIVFVSLVVTMLFGRHVITGSILKLFILYKLFQSKRSFFEIILTNKKYNKANKDYIMSKNE